MIVPSNLSASSVERMWRLISAISRGVLLGSDKAVLLVGQI